MKKHLFLCSFLLCFGFAQSAFATEADGDAEAQDARLKKALLQEILSDKPIRAEPKPSAQPEHPSAAAPVAEIQEPTRPEPRATEPAARPRATPPQEGIGTAVASISIWPLVALAAMLGGALWWTKRLQQPRLQAAPIQKLAMIPLGGKRSLAVVDVMGRKLVIGLSEKSVNLLTCIEEPGISPSASRPQAPAEDNHFEEDLRSLLDNRERGDQIRVGKPSSERDELARKFRSLGSA